MKYLPLIWAQLSRKRTRSAFTLISVVSAFLLFGMLQGINVGYAEVIEAQRLDRLLTDPRVPAGAPMPVSAIEKIENLPGVRRACGRSVFWGFHQNPKNSVVALATDPDDFFAVRPEFSMPASQLTKLRTTRSGMALAVAAAEKLGLKVGDRLPVHSPIARKDGNPVWTFEVTGLFDDSTNPGQPTFALINWDYFDAARSTDIGTVDQIIVRIADPTRAAQTGAMIDSLFANSSHETRTQSEREMTGSAIQQIGDIRFFTSAIMSAVFFALLFVTGNTMVQSVRERIPEFGVMRTIGFSSQSVFMMVLFESCLLAVTGASIGLAIAAALFPRLENILGLTRLPWFVVALGLLVAIFFGFVSALIPAWRVRQLRIVEALGGAR